MTHLPSALDAWSGSAEDELTRLVERARATGRLTQHDLVRALAHVEMTPEVLAEIYRRCRAAGIVVEETEDLDLTHPPEAKADEHEDDGDAALLPGADLVVEDDGTPTVVVFTAENAVARGRERAHLRRLSATMRRRTRMNAIAPAICPTTSCRSRRPASCASSRRTARCCPESACGAPAVTRCITS